MPLAEKLLEVPQELIRTALELELQEGAVIADRVGETPRIFLAGLHTASFDGRPVTYGFGELDALVPAYAASIHKSQGSEYPAVLIPVMTQHYAMLQRNLLYTGGVVSSVRRNTLSQAQGMEWMAMERRYGRGFDVVAKEELWDRWRRGESLKAIGRAFGTPSSSIYFQVAPHGGIHPRRRRRSRLALTFAEREEISRGIAAARSLRAMARCWAMHRPR